MTDASRPEATEVRFECALFGPTVIRFDGAVLERFSLDQGATGSRYHCSMISVHLRAPDRKDLCKLELELNGIPGGFFRLVHSRQAHLVEPLLAALHAAGVHVTRGW